LRPFNYISRQFMRMIDRDLLIGAIKPTMLGEQF